MNATANPAAQLDALGLPLQGSHLIEASAGTGKTFTIALLYLRLVLGHGRADPAPGLTPPEILVMTFTDAATQELRDRIRARLAQAADVFRQDPGDAGEPAPDGDPLYRLRADYPPERWPACARRLQLAAEWMDEAAVSTIHAWCYRMLREHAFDSDSLFSQELETDQGEPHAEATRDYWRSFLAPLEAAQAETLLHWWRGPDDLDRQLRPLTARNDLLEPGRAPALALRERQAKLDGLKAPWRDWVDQVETLLTQAYDRQQVDRRQIQPRYFRSWLEALRAWRDDPRAVKPGLTDTAWKRLSTAGLAVAWKQPPPPRHPALTALDNLPEQLRTLDAPRLEILSHAAHWVAARFAETQARRARMGFDDLLTGLRRALDGPNGERLADVIRRQFPAALIDEFQDTDPVQYEIFDRVYQVAANAPETTLILIGDPKQAIYAFRGADIHTYLRARRAAEGRIHTLGINYRSTDAMVQAANAWFAYAEARASHAGAFLFRTPDRPNPLPFVAAEAHGLEEALEAEGAPVPAMTVWCLSPDKEDKPTPRETYRRSMAEICATEMVRLLNLGQRERAGFVRTGTRRPRPLGPADMAVLVSGRAEADIIRLALARRGVRSVYLSDRDSVYRTDTARDVLRWLHACAAPEDPRLIRSALATATLCRTWAELDRLNLDERHAEAMVLRFRDYQAILRRQGVLAMIRRLLDEFDAPARLMPMDAVQPAGPRNGERILTDVLHLAELLQHASIQLDGEHALIRYLAEQILEDPAPAGDDVRQIRLESDADLVRVVTVHKSKGLEYPLVFLPFAATFRMTRTEDIPLIWHDDQGEPRLSLEAEPDIMARCDRERLGEDVRKFYVALTRARHATWVGLAPIRDLCRGAPGYLLNGDDPIGPRDLATFLGRLSRPGRGIHLAAAPAMSSERFTPPAPAAPGRALRSRRVVGEPWWIASYSALKAPSGHAAMPGETAAEDTFAEALGERIPVAPEARAPVRRPVAFPHTFPKGAEAGTFLHDLLEWMARQGFGTLPDRSPHLRDLIARRCQSRGWSPFIDPLADWLLEWVTTPLDIPAVNGMRPTRIRLAELDRAVPEMEFWLSVSRADAAAIDALITRHTLAGEARPPLPGQTLNGLLKGFMDLVFAHEERYYVVDYKSNAIGPTDADYTSAALRGAILRERYEVQYVLYLLALHRHLRSRLPDYDYERHVGGAIYPFLRGLRAPGQGLHVERPPADLIEALDRLCSAAPATVAT